MKNKYLLEELNDDNAKQVVINNVLYNKTYAEKLCMGVEPSVVIFVIENKENGKLVYENQDEIFKGNNILVGVELESDFSMLKGVVYFGMNYMHFKAWMKRIFRIVFVLQSIFPV